MRWLNPEHTLWTTDDGTRSGGVDDPYYQAWCADHGDEAVHPYDAPAPTGADVNAEWTRRQGMGFKYDFGGGAVTLDLRGVEDQLRWTLLLIEAQGAVAGGHGAVETLIRDKDNINRVVTYAGAYAALDAMKAWGRALMLAAWGLKDTPGGIPADYADDGYWPAL